MTTPPGFMVFDREAVYAALFALWSPAYAWKNTPARRAKLWTEVPAEERPAAFQFEGHDEEWNYTNSANPVVYLEASIYLYFSSPPGTVGATELNQVLNAITNRLIPTGRDLTLGKQTLGGLVQWARIQGSVLRVPGDIDGDGMAIVPIRMMMGSTY